MVINKDHSKFSFGFYQSEKAAKEIAESINESRYLKPEDKAMVITLVVSGISGSEKQNKLKSKKTPRVATGDVFKKIMKSTMKDVIMDAKNGHGVYSENQN